MTVRELIAQLQEQDPDAVVFLEDGGQCKGTVEGVAPVGSEEEDEERAENGDGPLRDNWRASIGLEPGPAVAIWFQEA